MHITGPSSARQGERVTITASGAPGATEQIKFNATGNSGFDIISTTSGSASFSLSLDFSGTTSIEVLAQDKFGATLASASHSITVKDTSFDASRPANGRLGGGAVSGPSTATVGDTINFTANGSGTSTTVRFSASNAEMGWMTPVSLSGGTASGSARVFAEGQATIYATFYDDSQMAVHEATHVVQVSAGEQRRPNEQGRYGMGGSLSGITRAIVGTMADIQAQGYGETEQVEFSASNADMGWMMPQPIPPGGSISASVRLTTEGLATIVATFKDKLGNVLGNAQHSIEVVADPARRPAAERLGMGGFLSGISEAVIGTMTDIYAQGSGEAEQVEFSASNAEMGWMMPVTISPGGSTSASVRLTAEGTATIFAKFSDKMGNVLGTAQHAIRVMGDTSRQPQASDLSGLMNARAADIANRLAKKR